MTSPETSAFTRRTAVLFIAIPAAVISATVWYLQSPITSSSATTPFAASPNPAPKSAAADPTRASPSIKFEDWTADWDEKIAQFAASQATKADSIRDLFARLPSLPPAGRAAVARELIKLAVNEDFRLLLPYLHNPDVPDDVRQLLLADLSSRAESVKLPAWAEMASTPGHPDHDEAVAALQNILGYDSKPNGDDWNAAVQRYFQLEQAKAREDALKLNIMRGQQNN